MRSILFLSSSKFSIQPPPCNMRPIPFLFLLCIYIVGRQFQTFSRPFFTKLVQVGLASTQ
uniref:Uncharacterized protein n=1 Tax=Arundo donax TaxID=35708 RepID=A0A0A9H7N2_ARUDO